MSTRLVVTGTRVGRFDVVESLRTYVRIFGEPEVVILGDAKASPQREGKALSLIRSVDELARIFCEIYGHPYEVLEADWERYGLKAGPERNQRMIERARRGDHLLAFPDEDSRGTWDCFRRGQKAGLRCVEVEGDWVGRLQDMKGKVSA